MSLLVIYNPVCGHSEAKQFFDEHVVPLLHSSGQTPAVAETQHAGHAGSIVVDHLTNTQGPLSIVLGSGDGTLHEIINALNNAQWHGPRKDKPLDRVSFALVPCGTANALYSSLFPPSPDDDPVAYRLQSLRAFLARPADAVPLTLAITTIAAAPSVRTPPQLAISAVVTSTALHAAILHDSEALRATIPGIERFKTAAMRNVTRWYSASAKLLPAPDTQLVQIYDPVEEKFVPHPLSTEDDPIVDLAGPFVYFLSTVNVDRLEPAFRVTPLNRTGEAHHARPTMDVVVVRPLRDPECLLDSEGNRAAFAIKTMEVMTGAYKDGAHIQLRYADDGKIVSEGDGDTVVEYIRCGGWEWEPDEVDPRAHLVCADGAIFHIENGGRARCSAAAPLDENTGFAVYR